MRTEHRVIFGDSRDMRKIEDDSVHLIVTSPPYWQLKDYEAKGQIGFDDSYKDYIENLNLVWDECYRALHPGCRLCINIGDQFARSVYYGRYKVIPIRTEIIKFCESIGFDYMGAIIWQKVTTCNTSGGASVMGSYPYPRNGILKIDYEFILIFKKLGKGPTPSKEAKAASKLTQDEWNEYFSGHWNFPGVKQDKHLAMYPVELPYRLIKMFTFIGETVLDPCLGSGTTTEAAVITERNSVGYEIQKDFEKIIDARLSDIRTEMFTPDFFVSYSKGRKPTARELTARKLNFPEPTYVKELELKINPKNIRFKSKISIGQEKQNQYHKVVKIADSDRIILESGEEIKLLGINSATLVKKNSIRNDAIAFLENIVKGKQVELKFDAVTTVNGKLAAYVLLKNKTHVNAKLVKAGLALPDNSIEYRFRERFHRYCDSAKEAKLGMWSEK